MQTFTESTIEETALNWFKDLGYAIVYGGDIAPDESAAERENYGEVILAGRLKDALKRINPKRSRRSLGRCLSKSYASKFTVIGWQQSRFP